MKPVVFFLLIALSSSVSGQQMDSLWTTSGLKSEIQSMVLASDGTLIISTVELLPKATSGDQVYTIFSGIDAKTT